MTVSIQQSVNSGYLCLVGGLTNGIIFLFLLLLYNKKLKGGAFKGSRTVLSLQSQTDL